MCEEAMRFVDVLPAARQRGGLGQRTGQGILLLLLLAPLSGNPGSAQNPAYMDPGQAQGSQGQRVGNRESPFGDPDADPFQDEKRLRALNSARQKSMVSDTEKLLRLATELNVEIAGGNGATLTVAQLRKVAEIEKLARSIKDKMSTSVRGFSVYPAATPLQYP